MGDTFNIADVAAIHGIEIIKDKGSEVFAVCPFCGDRRGKFSYIVQKGDKSNIYNCFACDAHGGVLDLHMKLSGNAYGSNANKQAAKEIFQAINGNVEYKKSHESAKNIPVCHEAEKASDGRISEVYYALLKQLTLKDEHKADLVRRGLTETDIKRFRFRSTPDIKQKYDAINHLLEEGYDLEGVPGFYLNKKNQWDFKISGAGYFCPVYDGEYNLITGFQIRVDKPVNKAKYLWVSSCGCEKGVSSGAVSTFLPGKMNQSVIITEGILKATVIYSLLNGDVSVIGVPGVKSIKGLEDYLDRYKGNAYVFEAYDMDKAVKTDDPHEKEKTERIAEAAEKLKEMCQEYNIDTHSLTWDFDEKGYWKENFKGLDDFLLSYEKKDLFKAYLLKRTKSVLKVRNFFHNEKEVSG